MQLQRPATRFAVTSESKMSFLRELVSLVYTVQYSAEGEYVEDTGHEDTHGDVHSKACALQLPLKNDFLRSF